MFTKNSISLNGGSIGERFTNLIQIGIDKILLEESNFLIDDFRNDKGAFDRIIEFLILNITFQKHHRISLFIGQYTILDDLDKYFIENLFIEIVKLLLFIFVDVNMTLTI